MVLETENDKYPIVIVDYGTENITPLVSSKELEKIKTSLLKAIKIKQKDKIIKKELKEYEKW